MVDKESNEIAEHGPTREHEIFVHLSELRSRILRCLVYIAIGTFIGWLLYDSFFFKLLSTPVRPVLEQAGGKFLLTGIAEGFVIKMEISLLVGLILALPLVTLEGWGFVAPGLTRSEKRATMLMAPLSVILFAAGVVLAYCILPTGIRWMVGQNPPDSILMPTVAQTLLFILKMCLAFGLVFQLPVILMTLARIGIVNSKMLKSYWRYSVVVIGIVAAVITPSGDAFSMLMMAAPMVGLYMLSIVLVRLVERK